MNLPTGQVSCTSEQRLHRRPGGELVGVRCRYDGCRPAILPKTCDAALQISSSTDLEGLRPVGRGPTGASQLPTNFFDDAIAQENFDLHFFDQVIPLAYGEKAFCLALVDLLIEF